MSFNSTNYISLSLLYIVAYISGYVNGTSEIKNALTFGLMFSAMSVPQLVLGSIREFLLQEFCLVGKKLNEVLLCIIVSCSFLPIPAN
jgi:putative Mn2+ efflux pump MntP